MAGKQAKVLTDRQVKTAYRFLARRRHRDRDRVILLLSIKAGLRAGEIAQLTWPMILGAGGRVARNHLTQFQSNYQTLVAMAAQQQQDQAQQRQQEASAERQREAAQQERAQRQAAQEANEKAAQEQAAAATAARDAMMKVDFTPQDHFQTDCLANAKAVWEANVQGAKKYSAIELKAISNVRRNDLAVVMITGMGTDDFVHKDVPIRVACTIADGTPGAAKFLADSN